MESCEPTYEELKLGSDPEFELISLGCEPTYEELKLLTYAPQVRLAQVASLPMRS